VESEISCLGPTTPPRDTPPLPAADLGQAGPAGDSLVAHDAAGEGDGNRAMAVPGGPN